MHEDFFEEDESASDVVVAFHAGEPGVTRSPLRGSCVTCRRELVEQRAWEADRSLREPHRARLFALGRCTRCYKREVKRGELPVVTVTSVHLVHCNQCGVIGELTDRREARELRARHYGEVHNVTTCSPIAQVRSQLSDAEVARLRRAVGFTGQDATGD